jgi:hypothetical protein
MTTQNRREAQIIFRDKVLIAMDHAAQEIFNQRLGAADSDLPKLFETLDKHLETLAQRYNHPLHDYKTPA